MYLQPQAQKIIGLYTILRKFIRQQKDPGIKVLSMTQKPGLQDPTRMVLKEGGGGPNRIFTLHTLLRGVQFIISDRVVPEV